jgi:hypothetical protein
MSAVPLFSTLLSAIISAIVLWTISLYLLRKTTARDLLSEALAVQALEEAWILQGYDQQHLTAKLSENPDLKENKKT